MLATTHLKTVTHPNTNLAQRRATLLMRPTLLHGQPPTTPLHFAHFKNILLKALSATADLRLFDTDSRV